jgi:hypothetical protein
VGVHYSYRLSSVKRLALSNNITGSSNTAIGLNALLSNTASNNTAVGYEAAYSNTSGTGITAIGYQALRLSTGIIIPHWLINRVIIKYNGSLAIIQAL